MQHRSSKLDVLWPWNTKSFFIILRSLHLIHIHICFTPLPSFCFYCRSTPTVQQCKLWIFARIIDINRNKSRKITYNVFLNFTEVKYMYAEMQPQHECIFIIKLQCINMVYSLLWAEILENRFGSLPFPGKDIIALHHNLDRGSTNYACALFINSKNILN